MNIIQRFLTKNKCYTNAARLNVRGLMLHSVGVPQPNANVIMRQWDNPNVYVCVHGFIQADGTVYQCLPWDFVGWHAGGSANNTFIGVEMTEPASIRYTGGASFEDLDPKATKAHVRATYDTAVELFAWLCREYDLDPAMAIISHEEGHKLGIASNHADPVHLWNRYPELGCTMAGFRRDVQWHIRKKERETAPDSEPVDAPSDWAIKATTWAIRKGIFVGDGQGNYDWQGPISRQAVAQVLYNTLEAAGLLDALPDLPDE